MSRALEEFVKRSSRQEGKTIEEYSEESEVVVVSVGEVAARETMFQACSGELVEVLAVAVAAEVATKEMRYISLAPSFRGSYIHKIITTKYTQKST